MTSPASLERCWSFIQCQINPPGPTGGRKAHHRLAITLSRQTGSGAWLVAERLAARLQEAAPEGSARWTVFDKELVDKVLEDHNLPKKLAQFMPEDRVSAIEDAMQEIFGLHPPSWTLVHQTTETILKLAELGNVILIGRGANVVTARLDHVFHVRLVGSLERRVQRVSEHLKLDRKAALEFIHKTDRGRERYLKEHFKAAIEDPFLYDLVLNTDRIRCEDAADLIAEAALRRAAYGPAAAAPAPPPAGS